MPLPRPLPLPRPRARLLAALLVTGLVLALAPLGANQPVALAEPVASTMALYTACGRVFPDPQAFGPSPAQAPGMSPYAKGNAPCRAESFISYEGAIEGLTFMQDTLFPGFVEIVNLAETDDPAIRAALDEAAGDGVSAGVPLTTLDRDRQPLILIKVTDPASPVPEADREHFVFPLSIHGIERAGIEGGLRAIEDLATWGSGEPGRLLLETAEEEVGGARNLTVGEVLERSVSYFVLANPDGWRRGDLAQPGAAYQRYNGNGMDLNRDWPSIGYTETGYTPWSEPETRSFGRALQAISDSWTGGIDLHGQLIDRAFSFTLIGGSQRPYDKNQRVQQFVEQAYADAETRLAWSSIIKPNDAPAQCVQTGTGGQTNPSPDCDNRLYGVQYGTIWDTIDYTVTGAFGDWIDSPLGLNADGIDNEMSASHLSNCGTGTCYLPEAEQLHVDGNKSLIYAMLNFSLQPPPAEFAADGNVGYLVNPARLVTAGQAPPKTPPANAVAPAALTGTAMHDGTDETVLAEFTVDDNGTTFTGGITAEVTLANVAGASPASAGDTLLIQRRAADGTWQTEGEYFNQSPVYVQAGMRADANYPADGATYRVVFEGPAPVPLLGWEVRFTVAPGWPDPGQAPFDVSNMDFFESLQPFVRGGTLTAIDVNRVLSGERDLSDFDTVVAIDDAFLPTFREGDDPTPEDEGKLDLVDLGYDAADLALLGVEVRDFVETGGNLVLTDDSLRALEWLDVVEDGAVHLMDVYAGHVSFIDGGEPTYDHPLAAGVDKPGAAEGTNRRRQITEPVPLGYEVPINGNQGFQPQWYVDREAFDEAGGRFAGGIGDDGVNDDFASDSRVGLGEIPLGEGVIRTLGSFAPFPTNRYPHDFGLSSYAVTDAGYLVFRNLVAHQNPGQNENPDLDGDDPGEIPSPSVPPIPVPAGTELERYFGDSRVTTAVDVSQETFGPGEGNSVFVATAGNFPDALAGGPAAFGNNGPVLLTEVDALPAATRAEIQRLQPDRIFVLGGEAAVSPAVATELSGLAPAVERLAGSDRFATASAISGRFHAAGRPSVYVATGANFPDALAGGPPAALGAAPIILVERDGIPAVSAEELERLQPGRIVILGGPAAVSDATATALGQYAATVERQAGSDRFATAAAVSSSSFEPSSGTVYIATGGNFPDALTGGPAAGVEEAPILLVDAGIPAPTAAELTRLAPRRIVILGGTAAVSAEIEEDLVAFLVTPPAPEE